jgi:diadenosine tetraphosphate (Ap4A) HIT family hydrolase
MTDLPLQLRNEFFSEMMTSHEILQKEFNPKKMNMCSLGNVVDHIHWHFFPRYSDDPNFNNPPWLQMHLFENAKITVHQRAELVEKLKNAFSNVGP